MDKIIKPILKKEIVDESNHYASLKLGPLERGFGITIGNSLRRILLSSIPGYAVKSIKIEGVSHEFCTIKGVLEDVTEIILNIKELVLKADDINDISEKTLTINVKVIKK